MYDKITIKGITAMACHGLCDFERVTPQPFIADLELFGNFTACITDNVEDTIHYGEATCETVRIIEENSFFMIERLAEEIAVSLLAKYELLKKISVTLHKPRAPVEVAFSDISIQVVREK